MGYERLGPHVRQNEPLARYTVARLGGPADAVCIAESTAELRESVSMAWAEGWRVRVIGGGANILFSDAGFRGLIIVNHAKGLHIDDATGIVEAESGAALIMVTRECMDHGLAGFEWAIGIPGTVGGAVVGNAGAHGGDMAHHLIAATVLTPEHGAEIWPVERLEYRYRESTLKARNTPYALLAARLQLSPGYDPASLRARAEEFTAHRRRTQPPGASLGSMFRNPPGDYAGRLIEAAGLKGTQIGGVQISPVHANFFVNGGGGSAADYLALIDLARERVYKQFGIELILEVEVIGE